MKVKYTGKTIPLELTHNKVYEVISVEKDWYRIMDDTDDDYLYPPQIFEITEDGMTPGEAVSILRKQYPYVWIKDGFDFGDIYLFRISFGSGSISAVIPGVLYIQVEKQNGNLSGCIWQDLVLKTSEKELNRIIENPLDIERIPGGVRV